MKPNPLALGPMRLLLVLTVGVALGGCEAKDASSTSEPPPTAAAKPETAAVGPAIVDVKPDRLQGLLRKKAATVIDVRTPAEFAAGHIEGALNLNVDGPDFDAQAAKLDKERTYVLHCSAGTPGGRGHRAVGKLRKLGFAKPHHLEGGYGAWVGGKHPVVTEAADALDVIP